MNKSKTPSITFNYLGSIKTEYGRSNAEIMVSKTAQEKLGISKTKTILPQTTNIVTLYG